MEVEVRHQCLIYDGSPSQQLGALAAMIQRKLAEGYRCLYMNHPPMVAGLRSCLSAIGVDVVSDIAQARLILSSEPVTAEGGSFDIDLMLQQLENALDKAVRDGHQGLWATGDMTWEFGSEKNLAKLMEYEYRLEKLFRKRKELCGVCQYHRDTLPPEITRQALLVHGTIFINETLSRTNPHYVPAGPLNDGMALDAELDEAIAALCQLQNTKA